jgi:hypothetical protein
MTTDLSITQDQLVELVRSSPLNSMSDAHGVVQYWETQVMERVVDQDEFNVIYDEFIEIYYLDRFDSPQDILSIWLTFVEIDTNDSKIFNHGYNLLKETNFFTGEPLEEALTLARIVTNSVNPDIHTQEYYQKATSFFKGHLKYFPEIGSMSIALDDFETYETMLIDTLEKFRDRTFNGVEIQDPVDCVQSYIIELLKKNKYEQAISYIDNSIEPMYSDFGLFEDIANLYDRVAGHIKSIPNLSNTYDLCCEKIDLYLKKSELVIDPE